MLSPHTTLLGLLAMVLPTVSAVGCYSGGATFNEFYSSGSWSQNTLIQAIANSLAGTYQQGETHSACFASEAYHVYAVLQHIKGGVDYMQQADIRNDGFTETGACRHGSESIHGDWWYRIDPQDGKDC